jgi:hypothetical protein
MMHRRTRNAYAGLSLCSLILAGSAVWILAPAVSAADVPATAPARGPQTRPFTPADHVVTAPVSRRANIVLGNLIQTCAIINGEWDRHQGDPGCAELFSTLFGYRSGLRRGRQDLVAIGRVAVDNEFGKLIGTAGDLLLAGKTADMFELAGMPALMVSGPAGANSRHYAVFVTTLDWFLKNADDRGFDDVQSVGTAYVLAEIYRFDPRRKPVWIDRARDLAARVDHGRSLRCFAAFAWAAIARATGEPADLDRAKAIALSVAPRFARAQGVLRFDGPYSDVLSCHLTLADAMADLATLEPDGPWRGMAMEIVEYVFSDAYFNGRFLAHDRDDAGQAPTFCTGCNYHALYLADRMYGDTLKLDPVPPLRVIQAPLRIVKAEYGAGDKWLDVTPIVVKKVRHDRLRLQVSNEIGGDPIKNQRKELRVEYEFQEQRHTKSVPEGEWLVLP